MRIRPLVIDRNNPASMLESLKQHGIVDASRELYIFETNIQTVNQSTYRTRIGILIVTRVQDAAKSFSLLSPWSRHNTKEVITTIYKLRIDTMSLTDFRDSQFSVLNAYISGFMTNYDKSQYRETSEGIYGSGYDLYDTMMTLDGEGNIIVPPQYYSPEHMHSMTGDFCDLRSDFYPRKMYSGYDIVDPLTKVVLVDSTQWLQEERVLNALNDMRYMKEHPITPAVETVMNTFPSAQAGLIRGTSFIYDSVHGRNFEGGDVMMGEHSHIDKIRSDFKTTMDMVENYARDLEKVYGKLRLIYRPTGFGDQIRIILDEDPVANAQAKALPPGIDRGASIEATINETISHEASVLQTNSSLRYPPHLNPGQGNYDSDDIPF